MPKDGAFDAQLYPIRCDQDQLDLWQRASDEDHRPLAQWVRLALDREAKRQLREAGKL